jgi:hypothetical protein
MLPEQVTGRDYVRLIEGYLRRLNAAYPHPNRLLHYDDVVVAYLFAFFNATIRSLRCIEDASQLPGVGKFFGVDCVCKSTLSDANALFDPQLLQPLMADLRRDLPNIGRQDRSLQHLLDKAVLVDGSFFRLAADVDWAVRSANAGGPSVGTVRLNCQYCLKSGVPIGVSITGADGPGTGEGAAAIAFVEPGRVYLFDSGVVTFAYLNAIFDAGSHVCCNLAAGVNFQAVEVRPLSEADRAAGVVSDRIGRLPGSTHRRNAPARMLREVIVSYRDRGGNACTLRVLSDLLDLPARLIADLYRSRWQIELFFRWLKVNAHFSRLTSHSRNGIMLSFYVATIAAMLMCLRTQRPLSKYGYNLMAMVAAGLGDVSDVLPILEKREREGMLERQRLARKKATAAAAAAAAKKGG